MSNEKSYYINHNQTLYGRWMKESEAKEFGKTLTQDEWDENKIIEVTWYG